MSYYQIACIKNVKSYFLNINQKKIQYVIFRHVAFQRPRKTYSESVTIFNHINNPIYLRLKIFFKKPRNIVLPYLMSLCVNKRNIVSHAHGMVSNQKGGTKCQS